MSAGGRIWQTSEDGCLVWLTMTPDRIPGALQVIREGFLPYESVCTGLMLAQNERASQDFLDICELVAQDGASLVVVHLPADRVVGVAFNKIQSKPAEGGEPGFLEVVGEKCCNDPASSALVDFLIDVDGKVDVFERYGVSCFLEHMFLAVSPEFRGQKIAHGLVKCTEDMADALKKGEVVVENKNAQDVGLVMAVFTSRVSQRIGEAREWDVLARISHAEFSFQGKTFSERIGPQHPDNLLMAKKLS